MNLLNNWRGKSFFGVIMGSCLGHSTSNELTGNTSSASSLVSSCLGRHSTDDQDLDLISIASDSHKKDHLVFRIWNFKRKKKSSHILDRFWQHQDTTYAKLSNGNNAAECFSDIQLQNLDVNNLLMSNHTKESSMNYLPSRVPSSRASSSLDLEWEHEYSQMRHYQQQVIKQRTQMLQNYQQLQMMDTESRTCDETSADESWQYMQQDDEQMNSMASLTTSMADMPIEAVPLRHFRPPPHDIKASSNGERRTLLRTTTRFNNKSNSITRNSSHNSWSHISTPESLEWDVDEEQQQRMKMEDDGLDDDTLKLLHQIEQLKNQVLYETGDGLYDPSVDEYSNNETGNYGLSNRTSTKYFQLGDSDGENGNYS